MASKHKFLVVGLPRSGTVWIWHALQNAGREFGYVISHESDTGKHIHVLPITWIDLFSKDFDPSDYAGIVHQMRDPRKVWQSTATLALKHRYHMFGQHWNNPKVYEKKYVEWWTRADELAQWRYRVEDVLPGSDTWRELLERVGFEEHVDFPEGAWNDNSRKYRLLYREEPLDPSPWFAEWMAQFGYT